MPQDVADHLAVDRFQLVDVTQRESSQAFAGRRWSRHLKAAAELAGYDLLAQDVEVGEAVAANQEVRRHTDGKVFDRNTAVALLDRERFQGGNDAKEESVGFDTTLFTRQRALFLFGFASRMTIYTALTRGSGLRRAGRHVANEAAASDSKARQRSAWILYRRGCAPFLAQLPDWYAAAIDIAWRTGWRTGEVKSLTWAQVDFRTWSVRLEPGTTKNRQGRVFLIRAIVGLWTGARIPRGEAMPDPSFTGEEGQP